MKLINAKKENIKAGMKIYTELLDTCGGEEESYFEDSIVRELDIVKIKYLIDKGFRILIEK